MSLKASENKITAIDRFIHQALSHVSDAENIQPVSILLENANKESLLSL